MAPASPALSASRARPRRSLPTYVLSFHASYRCASSGACCTSGWDIEVEPDVAARLRAARRGGALRAPADALRVAQGRTLLAHDESGRCAFFRPDRTCAIHGQLGPDALPVSCRLFPRVCLLAPRGVSITLSHFCPTAAALLFGDDPGGRLVTNAPSFPEGAPYEGLDARHAPPPLLRPRVWLGWDGHERWERYVLDSLSLPTPPEAALDLIAAQAERLREWTVRGGPFPEHLEAVLSTVPPNRPPRPDPALLRAEVRAAVPAALRPAATDPPLDIAWDGWEAPLRRYLAARAFGSWVGVQGPGLRTAVRALQAALAVVRHEAGRLCAERRRPLDEALLKEAFRRGDLLLLHLASPEALARQLGRCEDEASGRS